MSTNFRNKNLRIFSFVVLTFFYFWNPALAQDSSGVRLQPAIIEELVEPGQVFRSTLMVTNISNTEKVYYLVARDIESVSSDGAPVFTDVGEKTSYSLSSWVSFSQPSLSLKANETREISFTVTIPKNAEPGGHFAGLFVSMKPPKADTIGSGVGYEVASIISLQVEGDITDQARIREFSTSKLIYTSQGVDFKTVVENLGNVLVRARGPLEIVDLFGNKVATLTVNDQGAVVLPDSSRVFVTKWSGEGLNIGRYQAVLGLAYGVNGKKTITATTSFWVLPLNLLLITIIGIIAFIAIFFIVTHLYIRKKLVQMGGGTLGGHNLLHPQGRKTTRIMIFTMVMMVIIAVLIFLLIMFA